MEPLILEQLDRHHRVKARVRIDRLPFTVGRGYDNDLILDDEYVSPNHIAIEGDEEGRVVIVDRGSTNGLYDLSRGKAKVDRLVVPPEALVRIGHTQIRLRPLAFEQYPTKIDRLTNIALNRIIDSRATLLGLTVLAMLAFYLRVFLSDYTDRNAGKLFFDDVLPVFVLIVLWSGVWAIISYINSHRSYFAVHVAIASMVTVLGGYLVLAEDVTRFGLSVETLALLSRYGLIAVITFVMLYGHMRFCSSRSPRTIAHRAVAACLALNGVYIAGEYFSRDDFSSFPSYHADLYPAAFQWREGMTLEHWSESVKDLAVRVQLDLDKERKSD